MEGAGKEKAGNLDSRREIPPGSQGVRSAALSADKRAFKQGKDDVFREVEAGWKGPEGKRVGNTVSSEGS